MEEFLRSKDIEEAVSQRVNGSYLPSSWARACVSDTSSEGERTTIRFLLLRKKSPKKDDSHRERTELAMVYQESKVVTKVNPRIGQMKLMQSSQSCIVKDAWVKMKERSSKVDQA